MPILFFHALLASVLFSALAADVFFLRSPWALKVSQNAALNSEQTTTNEWLSSWRKRIGILTMVTVLLQIALGLAQWMPRMAAYNPAIFHTKFLLVVALTVIVKIRLFKEKKSGIQIGLTRAMFGLFLVTFILGIWSKV
jgi:hypothetical protein